MWCDPPCPRITCNTHPSFNRLLNDAATGPSSSIASSPPSPPRLHPAPNPPLVGHLQATPVPKGRVGISLPVQLQQQPPARNCPANGRVRRAAAGLGSLSHAGIISHMRPVSPCGMTPPQSVLLSCTRCGTARQKCAAEPSCVQARRRSRHVREAPAHALGRSLRRGTAKLATGNAAALTHSLQPRGSSTVSGFIPVRARTWLRKAARKAASQPMT